MRLKQQVYFLETWRRLLHSVVGLLCPQTLRNCNSGMQYLYDSLFLIRLDLKFIGELLWIQRDQNPLSPGSDYFSVQRTRVNRTVVRTAHTQCDWICSFHCNSNKNSALTTPYWYFSSVTLTQRQLAWRLILMYGFEFWSGY